MFLNLTTSWTPLVYLAPYPLKGGVSYLPVSRLSLHQGRRAATRHTLDTFVEGVLQALVLSVACHRIPAFDKKLKTGHNAPDSWCTLTREGLLHVGWLPQRIPDALEAVPFSPTKVEVGIAAVV